MILYHGSMFDTNILKPAFQITGELVEWDETESNEFLYATTDRQEAIDQGFYSMFSQLGEVDQVHSHSGTVVVVCADPNQLAKACQDQQVYLYEIELTSDWHKVNNKHNGLKSEYKTDKTISDILHKTPITYADWNKDKNLKFVLRSKQPSYLGWS